MEIDYEQRRKELKELQSESLPMKIQLTMAKLIEFYNKTEGKCYISCSGGADSIVLYDITQRFLKDYGLRFNVVFDDTGLEEPTVREKALSIENIRVVRPSKSFWQVLTEVGYPIVSKEVSECVAYARKFFDCGGGRYKTFYEKLFGSRYTSKGEKDIGNTKSKEYP